jgi:hypothetical protein
MEGIIVKLIVKNPPQGDGENDGKVVGKNPCEK